MTIYIQLTIAGTDVGPFDLYSNVDGFAAAFETGVSRASLVAGYLSTLAPDSTTQVKVQSTGSCTNFVIIDIGSAPPTTTTTSSSSTTTTSSSSTTTTTTTDLGEVMYRVIQCPPSGAEWIIDKTPFSPLLVGDNIQFTIGADPTRHCGEIVEIVPLTTSDGLQRSNVAYPCDDEIHCQ